ncbi:hypothetical protein KUCAC02_033559, partial [Chaenocephalus aceratus]
REEDISGVKRDGAQRQGEDITPNQGYNDMHIEVGSRAAQRNEEFAFEMQRFCLCVNVHNDRTHQVRSIPRSRQLSSGSGGCSGQLGNDGPTGSPASIDLHTVMNSPGVVNVCVPQTESSPDSSGTIDTSVSPTLLWAQVGIKDSLGNDGPTGSLTAEDLQTHPPPTAPAAYSLTASRPPAAASPRPAGLGERRLNVENRVNQEHVLERRTDVKVEVDQPRNSMEYQTLTAEMSGSTVEGSLNGHELYFR